MVQQALDEGRPYAMAWVGVRALPGWSGVRAIEQIASIDPDIQTVLCVADGDEAAAWDQITHRLGVNLRLLILGKPYQAAQVRQAALMLAHKWGLTRRSRLTPDDLEAVIEQRTRQLIETNRRLREQVRERLRSERALRESQQRYILAAAGARDGLWDWDLVRDAIFYSARWKAMLGYEDHEIADSPQEWFSRIHPDDVAKVRAQLEAHLTGSLPHFECEYRMRRRGGNHIWVLSRGLAVKDAAGRAYRIAGSQTDITDRKLHEQRLRYEACHDTLTGLSNRAILMDRLAQAIARAKRQPGYHFAVLFFDLDRFKLINDSLGHLIGDQLLLGVANRLRGCLRRIDSLCRVAGHDLARIGGDEFVVLLEGLRDPHDAVRVAQRLQQELAAPYDLSGHEVVITASIGIASSNTGYNQADEILRDADTALFRAKAQGRARHEMFDKDMHARAVARLRLESDLRRALDRGEFRLLYQPIVDLAAGRLQGFEALIRWEHSERGPVPPSVFIPIAEETGLIVPIGQWVLGEAIRCAKAWRTRYPAAPAFTISVNLSPIQISHPNLVQQIRGLLEGAGLDPQTLCLEITESAVIENDQQAISVLEQLRALRIRSLMDDFGTGYSSLSYLHRLPVDVVKIDQSFTHELTKRRETRAVVQAIVDLVHGLGKSVVAEGIETPEQIIHLQAIGCDYAQGYYLAQPLEEAQAESFLKNPRSLINAADYTAPAI
ncbi:MAG TPA: EAL domain-containing protein [Phycisphaeraceae bacterium]